MISCYRVLVFCMLLTSIVFAEDISGIEHGLILHLTFDDISVDTLQSSESNYSLRGVSNTFLTEGKRGKGLFFDGASNVMSLPALSGEKSNTITVSLWAKYDSYPSHIKKPAIIDRWDREKNKRIWFIGSHVGNIAAGVSEDGTDAGSYVVYQQKRPTVDTWIFIAMTFTNGTVSLYIDGILVDSMSANRQFSLPVSTNTDLVCGGLRFMSEKEVKGSGSYQSQATSTVITSVTYSSPTTTIISIPTPFGSISAQSVSPGMPTLTTSVIPATSSTTVAADTAAAGFSGTLDEIRIYDRALSPAEIGSLYALLK